MLKSFDSELNYNADILDDIVNTGLGILNDDLSTTEFLYTAPPKMILRHFLELIDASSILLRKSSISPAYHTLRSALESSIILTFLLQSDFKEKSAAYIVANLMEEAALTQMLKDNGRTDFKDHGVDMTIDEKLNSFQEILTSPNYINAYKELQSKQKGNKIPNWYKAYGWANTIKDIAVATNNTDMYSYFYSIVSSLIHGSNTISGNIGQSHEEVYIKPLRQPIDARPLTSITISIALRCFDSYYKYRGIKIPDAYKHWHDNMIKIQQKINQHSGKV